MINCSICGFVSESPRKRELTSLTIQLFKKYVAIITLVAVIFMGMSSIHISEFAGREYCVVDSDEIKHFYISNCDIDAITLLYDGGKKSEVICDI